jgi:hypothetical protein
MVTVKVIFSKFPLVRMICGENKLLQNIAKSLPMNMAMIRHFLKTKFPRSAPRSGGPSLTGDNVGNRLKFDFRQLNWLVKSK